MKPGVLNPVATVKTLVNPLSVGMEGLPDIPVLKVQAMPYMLEGMDPSRTPALNAASLICIGCEAVAPVARFFSRWRFLRSTAGLLVAPGLCGLHHLGSLGTATDPE